MRLSVVSELLRYSLFTSCATPCLLATALTKHLCAIGFFCSCSISHEKQGRKLYGFRPVKAELEAEGYTFASDSDCEIILPLYYKYGLAMFKHLDAEFAMILYDSRKKLLIAARDPIGIRPLFYGYSESGHIAFASEAKNLVGLCKKIYPCLLYTSDDADD